MLTPEKTGLLNAFLGGLPEGIALRLAKAVEVDNLTGGAALPHAMILEALRPALRHADTDRTMTPLRLLCQPFEDLLVSAAERKEKRKGRIARASVVPVWTWLSLTLLPDAAAKFVTDTQAAVLAYHPDETRLHTTGFWLAAADAIREALVTDRKSARLALGSDLIVADAEEMALLFAAGIDVASLQEKLPRGLHALNDDNIWMLRDIYDRMLKAVPDAAPYVPVIVMSRLEHPWEALKLPLHISRQTSDTMISSTDMGLAGEVLLGDMEEHANVIRAVRHPIFEPQELAAHVAAFSRLSNGLTQEVELRRDGPWHQRLMKDRTAVADTMEGLMERAPREILAALPVHKTGSYGGGPKAPDVAHAPDAEKTARGLRYARLLTACAPVAAAASFGASLKDALNEASVHLKSYGDGIVKELRSAEGPQRAFAERFFAIAIDFTAILFTAEEAEFLRRRGRAATADSGSAAA